MKTQQISATATDFVARFGNAAHQAIGLYRAGGDRLAGAMDQRWKAAMKQSSAKLSAETRKNANHAHQVFNGYFTKGVALSASGAEVAVDTLVGVTVTAIERTAAFARNNLNKTA
jgi:hypothetical protein